MNDGSGRVQSTRTLKLVDASVHISFLRPRDQKVTFTFCNLGKQRLYVPKKPKNALLVQGLAFWTVGPGLESCVELIVEHAKPEGVGYLSRCSDVG